MPVLAEGGNSSEIMWYRVVSTVLISHSWDAWRHAYLRLGAIVPISRGRRISLLVAGMYLIAHNEDLLDSTVRKTSEFSFFPLEGRIMDHLFRGSQLAYPVPLNVRALQNALVE